MAEIQADIQVFNQTNLTIPVATSDFRKITDLIAEKEKCGFKLLEVVYVDEEEIMLINKEHLGRDYVTDIITFRYDEADKNDQIEGTLFCCAPRIKEQAQEFGESSEQEFLRIYIHGLLHLAGYDDKTDSQKQQMTAKEDQYLSLFEQAG
ncbi:MAG: rRNA maturation RNase YbeY [Balneolaceae bacterium]|jgi:rRNA maturation RNase YbeY